MKHKPDMVRVIRDVRDGNRDYWLPREEAKALQKAGKLVLIQVYSDRLDYAEEKSHG